MLKPADIRENGKWNSKKQKVLYLNTDFKYLSCSLCSIGLGNDDASSDDYDIINETLILCFINSNGGGGGGQLIVDSVLLETSWITSLGKKMEMLVGRLVCP